ncbi:MAG: hypothetical protein QF893_12495 [Alphaproteobacteria bacterium]|nr:hypothetical protein [Alphaproteobacteria bacterium]
MAAHGLQPFLAAQGLQPFAALQGLQAPHAFLALHAATRIAAGFAFAAGFSRPLPWLAVACVAASAAAVATDTLKTAGMKVLESILILWELTARPPV